MRPWTGHSRRGFSLLELVIVVVILGLVAAIAIPRMSRGSQGAAESALKHNLTVIRNALERYRAEHAGQLPSDMQIAVALAGYSNEAGTVFNMTKTTECYIGPYLRLPPPVLPVGRNKGSSGIATSDASGGNGHFSIAWIYDPATGEIHANCDDDEVDASGMRYNQY